MKIPLKLTKKERAAFMQNLYFRNYLFDKFEIEIVENDERSSIWARNPHSNLAFDELLKLAGEADGR